MRGVGIAENCLVSSRVDGESVSTVPPGRRRIPEWLRGDYLWSVLGTLLPMAVYLVTLPLLSRLYTPSDFGRFAVIAAGGAILTAIASLRYEAAIMLPEDAQRAWRLLLLCVVVATGVTVTLSSVAWLVGRQLAWGAFEVAMLPAVAAFGLATALSQFFVQFLVRCRRFVLLAGLRAIQGALIFVCAWLAAGSGCTGLVLGAVAGAAFLATAAFLVCMGMGFRPVAEFRDLLSLAKEYAYFPRHSLLAVLLNVLAYQLVVLLMPLVFDPEFTGLFAQVNKVFFAPFAVVVAALGQVFYARAARLASAAELRAFLGRFHLLVGAGLLIPMLLLMVAGEELLVFFLGQQWAGAGQICGLMAPFFWLNLVFSGSSAVMHLYRKGFFELWLNALLLAAALLPFGMVVGGLGKAGFLASYSLAGCLVFAYFGMWTYRNANQIEREIA